MSSRPHPRLRKAREKQGLSLRRAAEDTGIKESILRAFEQGQPTGLKAPYESKLLVSYARYLSVAIPVSPVPPAPQPRLRKRFKARQPIATTSVIRTTLVSLIIAAVLGYGVWQLVQLVSAPRLRVEEPARDTIVQQSSLTLRGKTTSAAEVFVNNQPVSVDPEGYFEYTIHLRRGVNEVEVVAVNTLAKKSIVRRTVIYKPRD